MLSGKVETRKDTSALEFGDILRDVAEDVSELRADDRVVVLAPNNCRKIEMVPAWACQKLLPAKVLSFYRQFYLPTA